MNLTIHTSEVTVHVNWSRYWLFGVVWAQARISRDCSPVVQHVCLTSNLYVSRRLYEYRGV